jgi:hypothetical protein
VPELGLLEDVGEHDLMSQSGTTQRVRASKLALIAGVLALWLAGAAFFLSGTLRSVAAGSAVGLLCAGAAVLAAAYLRRGALDVSRADVEQKARRTRKIMKLAVPVGAIIGIGVGIADDVAPAWLFAGFRWYFVGFYFGLLAFVALMFGPFFFWIARNYRSLSLPGMTSVERAPRAPMEPSRQQDSR